MTGDEARQPLQPLGCEKVDFCGLGALVVRRDGRALPLGGRQQRAVLARLLIDRGEDVPTERIADAVWAGHPPAGATTTIQTYVFHLREILEPHRPRGHPARMLVTVPGGYRLDVPPDHVDLTRFEQLVTRGRAATAGGEPAAALDLLTSGLALWRGAVLADFSDLDGVAAMAARLDELRLVALESRVDALMALGRDDLAAADLQALIAVHPLRERLHATRMLALYRSGRQAEALAIFREVRHLLDETLGVEPGSELRLMHERILRHDPALQLPETPDPSSGPVPLEVEGGATGALGFDEGPPPPPFDPPERRPRFLASRGRRLVAVTGILALGVAAVTATTVVLVRSATPRLLLSNSVGVVDEHGVSGRPLELGGTPSDLAATAGALWVVDSSARAVHRVDPDSGRKVDSISVPGTGIGAIAAHVNDLWVTVASPPTVVRINVLTSAVVRTYEVGANPVAVAAGATGVWVANHGDNTVQHIDPAEQHPDAPIRVGEGPDALAIDGPRLWVANGRGASVAVLDSSGGRVVADIPVDPGPSALVVRGTSAWVASALGKSVSHIVLAADNSVSVRRLEVDEGPSDLALADDRVWVANTSSATISWIDPVSEAVTSVGVGSPPRALATLAGRVWVATGAFADARHQGGTLTLVSPRRIPTVDPAAAYFGQDVQLRQPVYDGLVALRVADGQDGSTLVADLATTVPLPSNDGRTYVFTIRSGVLYSTGAEVVASDLARGVRRAIRHGANPGMLAAIDGAAACIAQPTRASVCSLATGVVADDAGRRLTLHLTRPDPDLMWKLARLVFAAPPGTPDEHQGLVPIAGTGPYMVRNVGPDGSIHLVRNPRFTPWSVAAQPPGHPDEIVFRPVPTATRAAAEVVAGTAHVANTLDPSIGMSHPELVRTYPTYNTDFLFLNVTQAPFDDVRVRRALNLATDRRALMDLYPPGYVASPTCQLIPVGLPGYQRYCPHQTGDAAGPYVGPDIVRAQRLVDDSGTTDVPIVIHARQLPAPNIYGAFPAYFAKVLKSLGFRRVSVEPIPASVEDAATRDPAFATYGRYQAFTQWGWIADYQAPSTFFDNVVSCSIPNYSSYCDPSVAALAEKAQEQRATAPMTALATWAEVDRRVTDAAPFVTLGNHTDFELVTPKVGNVLMQPGLGVLLSQVWVR